MKEEKEAVESLQRLLAEWRQPGLAPSAGFEASLRRRIAASSRPRPWFAGVWMRAAVAGALAVGLGFFVYSGQNQPAPQEAYSEATQVAVVRDLQVLNRNAELLEHLDFLAVPAKADDGGQE